jgi:hypothetical protein
MGLETNVTIGTDLATALTALGRGGVACQVLMVDGQLVPPAAPPPASWTEVRLRTPAGMVTVRRRGDQATVLVFGNAAPEVLAVRDRVAEALAGGGA